MNSLDGLQEYQFIILCQDTTMYLVKYSNQCNDEFSYHSVVLQQYIQYSLLKQSLKLPFNNMLTYADTLSTITLHIVVHLCMPAPRVQYPKQYIHDLL